MRCNGSNWAVYSPGSWDGFRNDVWALWAGVIMRLEHHLVGGYVRYISPHIIIIIIITKLLYPKISNFGYPVPEIMHSLLVLNTALKRPILAPLLGYVPVQLRARKCCGTSCWCEIPVSWIVEGRGTYRKPMLSLPSWRGGIKTWSLSVTSDEKKQQKKIKCQNYLVNYFKLNRISERNFESES